MSGDGSSGPLNPHPYHIRSSNGSLMSYAVNWVNSQTATFCQDYETPKEFHHPKRRVTARLLFSVFVCMTVILALLVFLYQEDIPFKTVRYWGSSYAEQQFVPAIYSANATQSPNYKTVTASMLCPCSNTAVSWMSYVDFYTISYTLKGATRNSTISDGSDFCTKEMSHLDINNSYVTRIGCPNLVNSIVNKVDDRTIFESTALMDPVLLNATVVRHIQSNLVNALNDCVFLMSNSTDWNEFDTLRNTYELFADMLKLYASNPHVSDTDFWIMANETISTSNMPLIQVLDNQRALGIQVNWISYLEQCDPVYCDVVKEVSFTAKCFSILAEIGGIGALLLIVIRKILWPLLRIVCGWQNI